jgi:hypothetical protein
MSWSWYIYSEKTAAELNTITEAYEAALGELLDSEDAEDDGLAQANPSGPLPSPSEVVEHRARFGERVKGAVLERLPRCRCTLELEYVRAEPEDSPLQVTALRFLLAQLAPCLMDWGDLSIELGEDALKRISRLRSRGRLAEAPRPAMRRKPVKRRVARPGEVRALQILAHIDAARAGDRDAALDVQRVVDAASEVAQRYLALLIEGGPCSDRIAAKRLGLSPSELQVEADEIARALAG